MEKFHPSRVMAVRFADGRVVPMNRAARRKAHLYGDNLIVTRSRQPRR